MVEHTPTTPDTIVLDAGCGAGHTAVAFAPHVKQVIAYDFTASMLQQVQQLADERQITNIITQEGDVENLPFADDTFDIVATRYSAHHWLHPETALQEFKRVLKPNGTFIISDIMAHEDYAQDTFLQTLELLRDPSHVRDYRISEWERMLHAAGFMPNLVHTFNLTLHFDKWTTRMATPQQNREMVKALFNVASQDIKQGFNLPQHITSDDFNFIIPAAVIKGVLG
jgi:ubiquinone/menaquinone biosynthesis C-methylase UbiE